MVDEPNQTLHNTPKNQDIFPLQNIERLTRGSEEFYARESQTSHAIVEESKESSSQIVSGAMDIEGEQPNNPEPTIMEVNQHIQDFPLSQDPSALVQDHYISRSMASEPQQPVHLMEPPPSSRQPLVLLKL